MPPRARAALRHRSARVSYREPSSDEDLPENSPSDADQDYGNPRHTPAAGTRRRRSARNAPESHEDAHQDEPARKRVKRKQPKPTQPSPQTRRRRAPALGSSRRAARPASTTTVLRRPIPSDEKIPEWTLLPFEVLVKIFEYASYPLRSATTAVPANVHWLLDAATSNKAFLEPALTALYEEPPLFNLDDPHQLLALLHSDSATWLSNYKGKIRQLRLDAQKQLAHSVPNHGIINVCELIRRMPRLHTIDLTDVHDRSPFRHPLGKFWSYPSDFFDAIDETRLQLRSWRWHGFMLAGSSNEHPDISQKMVEVSKRPAFRSLRHLSLSHFHLSEESPTQPVPASGKPYTCETLDQVLEPLKDLESLEFLCCTTEIWSPTLRVAPDNLKHLTIVNCPGLISEELREFLSAKGRQLQTLKLNHNQALSLEFLVDLRESCPVLEDLSMDMTYYSPVVLLYDSEPTFFHLLTANDIPTWPKTLKSIRLLHMRKWDSEAAEHFFTSLLESAGDLPHLREIVLKIILSVNWRDRAGFRGRWIGRLQQVFLDRRPDPDPSLASFKAHRISQGTEAAAPDPDLKEVIAVAEQDAPSPAESQHDFKAESQTDSQNNRRSRRIKDNEASQAAAAAREEEEVVERASRHRRGEARSSRGAAEENDWEPSVVQGLCTLVDVSIDNMRPSENRFTEQDFLDDELSGDEDWNEGNDAVENTSYAW